MDDGVSWRCLLMILWLYKENINCTFGSKISTNFKFAAFPSQCCIFYLVKTAKRCNIEKGMLQNWKLWIFLRQNYKSCSPCIFCLVLKRIELFFNIFVSKNPLKNVSFVWKIGLGQFVFSTTVLCMYKPDPTYR